MAYKYDNSHNLGNGLEEIQFFSKDIDYDKEFYESRFLEKDSPDGSRQPLSDKLMKPKDILKIWEMGDPVKVLRLPDFDVYPLYFTNFQELDYYELKDLLGNFFTLYEFENKNVRVTYKTEDDLRVGYQALKKDRRYHLRLDLDLRDYYQKQKVNVNKNDFSLLKNNKNRSLINQWMNNGEVVTETPRNNCFPIQIRNYKHFNHDELMELFSKYGKFTSIVQFEQNGFVQVKFCSEEAARKCVIDLKKDRHYNVRLLFFLKELNTHKKLVKEVAPSKLDAHVMKLLNAEERIKFVPNEVSVKGRSVNRKNKKEEQTTESNQHEGDVIYYKRNADSGNVYVKGIPLHNPYLTPPYSYKVWCNKKNYLPEPTPEDFNGENESDVNYKYYLKNMKVSDNYSHSTCSDDA